MGMRAAVTGGQGFIGSHLVDDLVDKGAEVVVFDNGLSGDNHNPGAAYVDVDLASDFFSFRGIDVVFHTAAIGRTPWAIQDPVKCWNTNLTASVRVMEAAREADVHRVVLSSSNIVYAAETPYKASKLAMEDAAKVYYELYGLSVVCLRYANTYGERQREDGPGPNVFASLRKSLREHGYVKITGDGKQSRDFVHVSDVVRANMLAAQRTRESGVFDICTGRNVSMNQIATLIGAEVRFAPERVGDVKHIHQDPKPAEKKLGFETKVLLESGIWDSFPERVPA